ncbi:Putative F-box/FBD/LRR-repeat protein At4g03220 [Linum perenne]
MAKRSKRIEDRIDRLSDLPDSILHHILSFLDTESSVQTCILSRRWRCLWKYVHVLTFTERSLWSERRLERFVDNVLSLRSDRSSISRVTIDFGEKENKHLFDRVMKSAASHGVQELLIFTPFLSSLDVVRSVCSCYQSLKILQLNQINVDKNGVGLWSCLQLLRSLTLTDCCLNYGDAFANFPRLETLKLDRCFHFGDTEISVLKVTGSNLLDLEIVFPEFDSLEIVAPKLQSFSLEIDPYCYTIIPDVSKSNLPCLNRANIKLLWSSHVFSGISSSASDNDSKKQTMLARCASLFKILYNVQALDLQVETFELLVEICILLKRQACPFERMRSLSLKHSEESLGVVPDHVISYFLGGSHNEEDKRFKVEDVCLESHSSEIDPDYQAFMNHVV